MIAASVAVLLIITYIPAVSTALPKLLQKRAPIQETSLLTQKARVPRMQGTEVIPLIPSRITVILTGRR